MTLRVGRIPYLSCEPFYFDMARRDWHLVDLVPSALAQALEQGEIDAGPAPVAIASGSKTGSVFYPGFVWPPSVKPAVCGYMPNAQLRT
ncbi:MAG: hypothetical protein ETSY2_13470 [Candidatus Entotheonella gemina]|uniref:Uncharacterized protein n=1 Tax=Candidatus Entotheonella gemina TaxID=1429439 RepID=W4MBM0_9BACT|nr:MAG: hypothetical protein ETSY2_13470 [Candidatus Entotheonella gemina]